jgi:hypothetical protein
MDYVLKQRGLQLLTPIKRQEYRHYLNNRKVTFKDLDKAARRRAAADMYLALTFFELQDNQAYRKVEKEKDCTWLKPRYAACTYDACELICKAHENLKHARKYIL